MNDAAKLLSHADNDKQLSNSRFFFVFFLFLSFFVDLRRDGLLLCFLGTKSRCRFSRNMKRQREVPVSALHLFHAAAVISRYHRLLRAGVLETGLANFGRPR